MNRTHNNTFWRARVVLSALVLSCGVAACDADGDDDGGTIGDAEGEPAGLLEDLDALRARADLEDIAACYGVGHDTVFFALGGDQSETLSILGDCFAADVQSEFVFFGGDSVPLDGLPALVSFIETFALDTGYHTARNMPGNVQVEMLSSTDAIVTTSGSTPHFSLSTLDAPFIDLITARYTHVVSLDDDGRWRTTEFIIEVDEVARFDTVYPLGQ
ncbi:MAG: hypothetical protein ACRBN8_10225 [Nannocystales bacterium]